MNENGGALALAMKKAEAEREARLEAEARAKNEENKEELIDLLTLKLNQRNKEKTMSDGQNTAKPEEKKELTDQEVRRVKDLALTRAANILSGTLITGAAIGLGYGAFRIYSGRKAKTETSGS